MIRTISALPFMRLAGISLVALALAACSDNNSGPIAGDAAPGGVSDGAAGSDTTSASGQGPVVPAGSEVAEGAPGQPLAVGEAPAADSLGFSLQSLGPGEKSANLISLDGDWPSWSGQYTGIWYNGSTGQLHIPAPAWPGQIISGVRRFEVPLEAGKEYALSLSATDDDAAAMIFLQGYSGELMDITNASTGVSAAWAGAKLKEELRFTAPNGVAAFFVQVQSAWNTTSATNLAANLTTATETATSPVIAQAVTTTQLGSTNFALGDRPSGYDALFFGDEFDGNSLDRSKWCTRYDYGGGPPLQVPDGECTKFNAMGVLDYANASEEQRYRDFNEWGWPLHIVSDGTIKLLATKSLTTNWYAKYESAAIRGKKVFKPDWQTSYFVTARIKLPDVKGTWPSLWLNPSLEPYGIAQWPPEIDVFEAPLNRVEETRNSLVQTVQGSGAQWDWDWSSRYWDTDPNYNTQWNTYHGTENLRDRWLVVSAEWTAGHVCFYIDSLKTNCQKYRWITNGYQEANPASLLINMAIGGPWAGRYGIEDEKFPTQFELDWVRIYRKGPANY
jgi:beta-glucanase (GH16 family)